MPTATAASTPAPAGVAPVSPPTPAPSPTVAPSGGALDDLDRRTLKRALGLIRSARAGARSHDSRTSKAAYRRLVVAYGYLVGYLDGKGMLSTTLPGYASVFQTSKTMDLTDALDDLERQIEAALDPTRVIWAVLLAGAAIYAVGAYLLAD